MAAPWQDGGTKSGTVAAPWQKVVARVAVPWQRVAARVVRMAAPWQAGGSKSGKGGSAVAEGGSGMADAEQPKHVHPSFLSIKRHS